MFSWPKVRSLFRDSVSFYSTAYIYEWGYPPKKNNGIYGSAPSVYEKNKKDYKLDRLDKVADRNGMTSFTARPDLLMLKSLSP